MSRRHVGGAMLALAGLVNAVPVVGTLSTTRLRAAYGLQGRVGPDSNLDVLLQHRGTLFLTTGGLLLMAVARPHLRAAAITINAVSCASFVALGIVNAPVNAQLGRVMWVDVGLLALLAGGAWLVHPASVQGHTGRHEDAGVLTEAGDPQDTLTGWRRTRSAHNHES